MRQHGEHGATRCTLYPPDGDATQPDPDIMGVARQAPPAVTGRLVRMLKAQGQNEGEDELDKRFAIAQQAKVGRFIPEINSDGAVVARRCGCCAQSITPRSSRLVS